MVSKNSRTIMIGHQLAKLYGSILEHGVNHWAGRHGYIALWQAGYRKRYGTLDHVLTLQAIIEWSQAH